jgi:hypothetical protein
MPKYYSLTLKKRSAILNSIIFGFPLLLKSATSSLPLQTDPNLTISLQIYSQKKEKYFPKPLSLHHPTTLLFYDT